MLNVHIDWNLWQSKASKTHSNGSSGRRSKRLLNSDMSERKREKKNHGDAIWYNNQLMKI
ncbi:hypothetical protein BLOT_008871 [Blomia tropicalis]|nr:hypothetical protein BLOT_008871 [Blomia tropicalis]